MNSYDILGIKNDTITEDELKCIYRKLILKHHPDKGGDSETFNKITKAYEEVKTNILTKKNPDEIKKGFNVLNIVKSFVSNKINKEYKDLYLTLDEMYNGKIILINYLKYINCTKCLKKQCNICNGIGKNINNIEMFGIKQKIHLPCQNCNSEGIIRECKYCDDTGLKEENINYKLKINKGTHEGEKFAVENNSVIFTIKQEKHTRFIRHDNDLILFKNISAYEALQCQKINCKHLNNKVYSFFAKKQIQNDDIFCLKKLGMPIKNTKQYGNLYVKFNIITPEIILNDIPKEDNEILKKYLNISINNNTESNGQLTELQPIKDYELNQSLFRTIFFSTRL